MDYKEEHLLQLIYAKENEEFQEIKKRFSEDCKYFFNIRRNITIVYDKPIVYVVHKEYLKIIDLRKAYIITDLAYNYKKNVVLFLTAEGQLYAYLVASKTQIEIKKDFKKVFVIEWIYSCQQFVNFFVAQQGGIHLYRIFQEEKKIVKQVKHISGKYHCFLYEPLSQFLTGFQYGDCDLAYIFHFDPLRAKNWFRCGEIEVSFNDDEVMAQRIKSHKWLGLEGSRVSKEISMKKRPIGQDYLIDIQSLHKTPYLFFYYSNQGKLKLTPLVQSSERKQLTIKLPSDSPPSFNVFDNMLVVHLKNQKITFIYDINPINFQALVSPYPLVHQHKEISSQIYSSEFISKRVLLPNGHISKWKISLSVIYHYLKNEMQVFQFLTRRVSSKIQTIKWMRQNLFNFKQVNLSKMWKFIFIKIESGSFDQSEIISMIEVYTNLFYTLSIDPLIDRIKLVNILIECIRQANQYHILIPVQLQLLTVQLLLSTQQYELLVYLSHNNIIKEDPKIFKLIYQKGQKQKDDLLLTLSVDIAYQCSSVKDVLRLIMKSQRLKEGKRFIRNNYGKMEALDLLEAAKYINNFEQKVQFVGFLRNFIVQKYSSINAVYLDQAEKKLFQ